MNIIIFLGHVLPQNITVHSDSGIPLCSRHPNRRPSRRTDIIDIGDYRYTFLNKTLYLY